MCVWSYTSFSRIQCHQMTTHAVLARNGRSFDELSAEWTAASDLVITVCVDFFSRTDSRPSIIHCLSNPTVNKNILPSSPLQTQNHRCWIYADVKLKSGLIRPGETQRDSRNRQTLDYSEDPLKPRTSLITDQTVSVLSSQPQIDGGIKTSPIWIENPPSRQENNSPSRWSRGSSFGFLNTRKLYEAKLFLSAGGGRWGKNYWCGIQEGTAKKKSIMLMTVTVTDAESRSKLSHQMEHFQNILD